MEILQIPIEDLKPNEKNPRRIKKSELESLKRSIKEFGFQEPVIVNKHKGRENILIGGHQRVKAAVALGMKTVPVVYVDLPKDKEETFNIALNKISGDWDEEKLAIMLQELLEKEADISLTGFAEPEVDKLMDRYEKARKKEEEIDKAPPVPITPKSKKGDIWKLGIHTLMCGDSTNAEDFKELMGETKADLCVTDPPYGVSYKGTKNPNGKPWGVMSNDELRGDELYNFLKAAYKNIFEHTKEGAGLYTCYASINHIIFEQTLNLAGWIVKQQLIWEKGHVLEPFCGSGSTLMACETTSRVCMGLELDPKYVDVILERWSKHTEKDPIRADGKKWSEL